MVNNRLFLGALCGLTIAASALAGPHNGNGGHPGGHPGGHDDLHTARDIVGIVADSFSILGNWVGIGRKADSVVVVQKTQPAPVVVQPAVVAQPAPVVVAQPAPAVVAQPTPVVVAQPAPVVVQPAPVVVVRPVPHPAPRYVPPHRRGRGR